MAGLADEPFILGIRDLAPVDPERTYGDRPLRTLVGVALKAFGRAHQKWTCWNEHHVRCRGNRRMRGACRQLAEYERNEDARGRHRRASRQAFATASRY